MNQANSLNRFFTIPFRAKALRSAVALIVVAHLAACSFVTRERTPTYEEKIALVRITQKYLTSLMRGDENALNSLILWSEFLARRGTPLTKAQVLAEGKSILTRWPEEDSPLLKLDVVEIRLQGDNARVTMQRFGRPDFPTVTINLFWMGRAWLIEHDSIFGIDGVLAKIPATNI
jgi:hypothetical protein